LPEAFRRMKNVQQLSSCSTTLRLEGLFTNQIVGRSRAAQLRAFNKSVFYEQPTN
jgi:hypothetical protein